MNSYIASKSGNRLVKKEGMFFWRGRFFPGLIDEKENALYDHPEDSFFKHLGLKSCLDEGLITESKQS